MSVILLTLVLMVVVGVVLTFFYQQHKTKSAVEGKLYCTFLTQDGSREEELLPKVGNQIIRYDKVSGNSSAYLFKPNKTWNSLFPPFKSKILQVTIKSAIYMKDNPEPLPWSEDDPAITPEVLGNLQDARFSEMMKEQAKELTEADKTTSPLIMYILLAVPSILSIAVVYLLYKVMLGLGM